MLYVNTNYTDDHYARQAYEGMLDFERLAEHPRVRVRQGQITPVNLVQQDGHAMYAIVVGQHGNRVSAGASL